MQLHKAIELFPPMSDFEFEQLKVDIETNGCHTALWKYKGKIIDGRHRFKACEDLGIQPKFKTFKGSEKEMISFVISQNFHRRQLSESQRAMVAANISNMDIGKPKENKTSDSITQPTAAKMLGIGMRSVSYATVIKKHGSPLLNDKVDKNEITVSAAEKIARLPHELQDKAIKSGAKTAAELAEFILVNKPNPVQVQEQDEQYQLTTISNSKDKKPNSVTYKSKATLLKAINTVINSGKWESITVSCGK